MDLYVTQYVDRYATNMDQKRMSYPMCFVSLRYIDVPEYSLKS